MMKRPVRILSLCAFVFTSILCYGQSKQLDLKQCIDLAIANNITLKQGKNTLSASEVNYVQSKFDFLPNVNASASVNKAFGTTVDNFTQAIAQSPWTGSPTMGATVALFQGLSKWNNLRSAEANLKASTYSMEDLKNDIRLNVALAFFQVIYAMDNMELSQGRLNLLEKQLDRTRKQLAAGMLTPGDTLAVRSQVATEQVNMIQAENAYQSALLQLIQAMNLDPSQEYELVRPDIEAFVMGEALLSPEAVFEYARLNNPGMREKEMRILAQKYAMKSARSVYYPSLSLTYGLGSFYSSNDRPIDSLVFTNEGFSPIYGPTRPFFTQLNDNFGHSLSLRLSIPIFNNYSTRQAYTLSQLEYDNALLTLENEENVLYQTIVQAHQDARAAQANYDAIQSQLKHLREAHKYAKVSYEAGRMDFYTFIESLDNKTLAEKQLIQARYDLVLKRKILDFYQGKTLSF